jgi:integrase
VQRHVGASTQNQALASLLFLYHQVLGRRLQWIEDVARAKVPERLPVVLSPAQTRAVLERLQGPVALVAGLLYGSGLRLFEALQLRMKDLDLDRREIHVRDGKGRKDRRTMVPGTLIEPLRLHLENTRAQHRQDLAAGTGTVSIPTPSPANIQPRRPNGTGNGSSRRAATTATTPANTSDATTFTPPSSSAPFAPPPAGPTSPNPSPPTSSATASPPTCWSPATTSAPSKNCWATRTSKRR